MLNKGSLCSENESIGGAMSDKKPLFLSHFPAEAEDCCIIKK